MNNLLETLGKDALPKAMLDAFVRWCVWEQARPALRLVLDKTALSHLADKIEATDNLETMTDLAKTVSQAIKEVRRKTGPLGLSAAEAAAFEFYNLTRVAVPGADFDPEEAAFFSARVCGWAGWASTDFSQPNRKAQAESDARKQQEAQLQHLWREFRPQP